jgi:channel protein (hemolysin III family)
MNPRACTNEAYTPTSIEHVANVATHGIWVVPSVIGGVELVRRSATWTQFVSACVYGTSLILVFAVSTFFHSVHYCNHNRYNYSIVIPCSLLPLISSSFPILYFALYKMINETFIIQYLLTFYILDN